MTTPTPSSAEQQIDKIVTDMEVLADAPYIERARYMSDALTLAIEQERERCAKVAMQTCGCCHPNAKSCLRGCLCGDIAAAIRKGEG